jgi:hypothetical protein
MSDITANIVVQPIDLNVQVQQSEITVTPEVLGLNIYAGGFATAAGNTGTIQYNNGGVLGGISTVTWNGTQLNLGNTNNITISGGSLNYALITDGAGNLSWGSTANANYANFAGNAFSVSGSNVVGPVANANNATTANTANIANIANVAYSVSAANVVGTVANANYAAFAGNVTIAAQPNITSLGNLTSLTVVGNSNLGNVGNVKVTGGINGYFLQTDGTGNLSFVAGGGSGNGVVGGSNTQVQFNNGGSFGGSPAFTFNNTSNVVTVAGNIVASNVASTPIANLPYGSEAVTITTTAPNTYNLNILSSSIVLCTANATANTILNIRGNSSVTANSIVSVGQSITNTILIKTGANLYTVTTLQIDGANQTINWVNGAIPGGASNSLVSYTFTAVKTATTPTYTVLGSATRYA